MPKMFGQRLLDVGLLSDLNVFRYPTVISPGRIGMARVGDVVVWPVRRVAFYATRIDANERKFTDEWQAYLGSIGS